MWGETQGEQGERESPVARCSGWERQLLWGFWCCRRTSALKTVGVANIEGERQTESRNFSRTNTTVARRRASNHGTTCTILQQSNTSPASRVAARDAPRGMLHEQRVPSRLQHKAEFAMEMRMMLSEGLR